MNFRKITAIIRPDLLEKVEDQLRILCVPGISVSKVKGYGEYANFFKEDWFSTHIRIEIFIHKDEAREVAEAIMKTAHTGTEGDGLVTISPVETVFHTRTLKECESEICD